MYVIRRNYHGLMLMPKGVGHGPWTQDLKSAWVFSSRERAMKYFDYAKSVLGTGCLPDKIAVVHIERVLNWEIDIEL